MQLEIGASVRRASELDLCQMGANRKRAFRQYWLNKNPSVHNLPPLVIRERNKRKPDPCGGEIGLPFLFEFKSNGSFYGLPAHFIFYLDGNLYRACSSLVTQVYINLLAYDGT